ncbi:MAG: hypothetical protein DWI58_03050 [Chloroflexi bacterium]|nr:MAG: hypothetical protein DWI58_03050 [Chloroflexota bacterium]
MPQHSSEHAARENSGGYLAGTSISHPLAEAAERSQAETGLEAELAVGRLAAALLAGGQALLLLDVLRVSTLRLVDVTTGDTSAELPVPIVFNNHEAAAARALLWRGALQHLRLLWFSSTSPASRRLG